MIQEKEQGESHNIFYDLTLKVTYYHFCNILLVPLTNSHTIWERTIQGCECHEAGIDLASPSKCVGLASPTSPAAFNHPTISPTGTHCTEGIHLTDLMRASPCPIQNNSFWSQFFSVIYSKPLMGKLVLLKLFRCAASRELLDHTGLYSCRCCGQPRRPGTPCGFITFLEGWRCIASK